MRGERAALGPSALRPRVFYRLLLPLLVLGCCPGPAVAGGQEARELLHRAFMDRYEVDTSFAIELVVRNEAGEALRRRLVVATRRIGGRLHSLGRFTEPEHLRGTTVLNIERDGGGDDHFLYLRSLGRIRRVGGSQRWDSFMGTDLTYEDFERRRVSDYRVASIRPTSLDGEAVRVVTARPLFDADYDRVEFWIASADRVILETRAFKRSGDHPTRVVRMPRAAMVSRAGHTLPTRMQVENRTRGTVTEVRIEQLVIDPPLDDALFTSAAVEVGRPIPGLE